MVDLSDEAAALIRRLVSERSLPKTAGLRLGTDGTTRALSLELAAAPAQHDLVVTRGGASLFVSPTAAERMAEQTLCAQVLGRPAFFVD